MDTNSSNTDSSNTHFSTTSTNNDYAALARIGLNTHLMAQWHALETNPADRLFRVVEVQRNWLQLHDGTTEHVARVFPALADALYGAGTALAVGDWVSARCHEQGEWWIHRQITPFTHLARRANDGRRQPLASNIDTALLVMGLDHDYNPRRMERYLALVEAAGVFGVVVLSKADIGTDVEGRLAELHQRLPRRVPIHVINGQSPEAALELSPWLGAGQTLVLLGSSGAGKSTLTNTLLEAAIQQTGDVRRGDGRGRHTTTARSLHLCPGGACIIDTPGLRTWRPDVDADSVAATFDDIEALAQHCHFRDCHHDDEPGCAVRGQIDADRLLNYHKLQREIARSQQTPLERKAMQAKWKVIGKAGHARSQDKRSGNW
ncbi:ribosome small subunit-dependent GTPase A [Chitinimonas sp. BJYL2]|uniref:ribosome small subunit-dependent GTPase A n=1 Tax=Chitinimonas sp. BJYL2 TaxID=2976696 RepID=UPI0022B37A43|nr:ribosome small subunit-dependent GTPase A [Chitinimonas sp. BJYL2]